MASTLTPTDAPQVAGATTADHAGLEFSGDYRSLVFRVAGRAYACDVATVKEVVPLAKLTRLPGAPDTVLGIINVRGTIITVVNAAAVLHRHTRPRPAAMVLIVDAGVRGVGLAVECVADVRALREDEGYTELDVRDLVTRVVAISEDE